MDQAIENKKARNIVSSFNLAEREGFEPPIPHGTPVFKTGAFNRSAISPDGTKLVIVSLKTSVLS